MTRAGGFKFFGPTEQAFFISRPNRFVLTCKLRGKKVDAFLPNPGRLWELLLPETPIYLEKTSSPNRSLHYTAVALEREGQRIVLHTHRTNDVARYLIESGLVPPLSAHEVVRGEVTRGASRFDFLLRRGGQETLLEVKSCTLFSKKVAMFPDAVTARGKKHLEELSRLSAEGISCAVLFLVHWPLAQVFLPDFHTDLEFARAMRDAKGKIRFLPVCVEWGEDLSIVSGRTKILPVLWQALEREAEDRGSYLILYYLPRRRLIEIGGWRGIGGSEKNSTGTSTLSVPVQTSVRAFRLDRKTILSATLPLRCKPFLSGQFQDSGAPTALARLTFSAFPRTPFPQESSTTCFSTFEWTG